MKGITYALSMFAVLAAILVLCELGRAYGISLDSQWSKSVSVAFGWIMIVAMVLGLLNSAIHIFSAFLPSDGNSFVQRFS